jgi:hypothetical protein
MDKAGLLMFHKAGQLLLQLLGEPDIIRIEEGDEIALGRRDSPVARGREPRVLLWEIGLIRLDIAREPVPSRRWNRR